MGYGAKKVKKIRFTGVFIDMLNTKGKPKTKIKSILIFLGEIIHFYNRAVTRKLLSMFVRIKSFWYFLGQGVV